MQQVAVRLADLPEGVRFRGKSKLEPDKDGYALISVPKIMEALSKYSVENGKNNRTFFTLSKEDPRDGVTVGQVRSVQFEKLDYDQLHKYVGCWCRIAARLRRNLIIHNAHGVSASPIKDGTDVLHVFPFSSVGPVKSRVEFYFDGQELDPLGVNFLAPSFSGKVFGDKKGVALAEWNGLNVHVLWNFCRVYDPKGEAILERIFDGSLQEVDKRSLINTDKIRSLVAEMVKKDHSKLIAEQDKLKKNIEELAKQLTVSYREQVANERLLGDPNKVLETRTAEMLQEIESIANLNGITSVEFDGKKLEATTVPMVIKDKNLGRWNIVVGDEIKLIPLDPWGGHPHINSGSICWGDMQNPVVKMLGRREYLALVSFLLVFLQSYNEADKHYDIGKVGKKLDEKELETASKGPVVVEFESIEGFDPAKGLLTDAELTYEKGQEAQASAEDSEEEKDE